MPQNSQQNTLPGVFTVWSNFIALYLSDSNGDPFGSPVWVANCLTNVEIKDSFTEKLTGPSGVAFRRTHHIDETHTVGVGSLMDFTYPQARNVQFVLYMSWIDQSLGATNPNPVWYERTYYGVTYMGLEAAGRDQEGASINQRQTFRGKFFQQVTGTGAPQPPGGYSSSS
jgi:hypothetical protein